VTRRRIFASSRARVLALLALAVVVAVLVAVGLLVRSAVPGITDPEWVHDTVAAYGPLAPAVFVLLQAVQVVIAPVPGQVVALVGGFLFGVVGGTLYSLVGTAVGGSVAFVLSRRYGRPFVERVIEEDALSTFDELAERDGRVAILLVFLVPGLPDDAICFLAGITRVPLWQFVALSVVGRLPGYLIVTYAGATLSETNYVLTTALLLGLAALTLLVYWRRDALLARFR